MSDLPSAPQAVTLSDVPHHPSVQAVDALLPQTQCTRCGFPDCRAYAQAVVSAQTAINRCVPGGQTVIAALSQLTGQAATALDPTCGTEGPRQTALIDEQWCIGCTLCLDACPVDAIVGANKWMHTVISSECTGCALCLPVCPVDCITMQTPPAEHAELSEWTPEHAEHARQRYLAHQRRLAQRTADQQVTQIAKAERKLAHLAEVSQLTDPQELANKQALIKTVLERARARRQPP